MLRKNTLEIARMKPEIIEDINLGHRALGHNFLEISVFFSALDKEWLPLTGQCSTVAADKICFQKGTCKLVLSQGNFTIYTIFNSWVNPREERAGCQC